MPPDVSHPGAFRKTDGKEKNTMLKAFFEENPAAAVAFSGGVDSAYLLSQAARYARDCTAYFVKTAFQPAFEREDAERLAAELGARLRVLELDLTAAPEVLANPPERCYLCKRRVFGAILAAAAEDGYSLVLDGSNLDDDPAQRPGMRALRELQVRSPLREAGLTKAEIRRLSREAGLFTWNKPSYSCLATRIPTGTGITLPMLEKIERGELAMMELGFSGFRLRWRPGGAKIELSAEQLPLALEKRETLLALLGGEFPELTLDLRPREIK